MSEKIRVHVVFSGGISWYLQWSVFFKTMRGSKSDYHANICKEHVHAEEVLQYHVIHLTKSLSLKYLDLYQLMDMN